MPLVTIPQPHPGEFEHYWGVCLTSLAETWSLTSYVSTCYWLGHG
jgi:hypothetical protein